MSVSSRRRDGRLATLLGAVCLVGAFSALAADLEFAHGLYRQGRFALAADEYAAVLAEKKSGEDADIAAFYLAECDLQLGKDHEALTLYDRLVGRFKSGTPNYRVCLFRAGQIRASLGDAEGAIPKLERFLKEFGSDTWAAETQRLIGDMEQARGGLEAAKSAYAAALLATKDEAARRAINFGQARLLEREGKVDEADREYASLAANPKGDYAGDAALARLTLAIDRGQLDRALTLAEPFRGDLAKSSLAPTARLYRGLAFQRLKRVAEAKAEFAALASAKDVPADVVVDAKYRLGLLRSEGEPAAAATELRALAAAHPQSPLAPDILLAAGAAALDAGNAALSRQILAELEKSYPGFSRLDQAWYASGRAALAAKDYAAVRAAYRDKRERFATSPSRDAFTLLVARALLADPKAETAEQAWAEITQGVKDRATLDHLAYYHAVWLTDQGKSNDAIAELQRLLAQKPADPVALDASVLLGVTLAKVGQPMDALTRLDASLEKALAAPSTTGDHNVTTTIVRGLAAALTKIPSTDPALVPVRDRSVGRLVAAKDVDGLIALAEAELEAGRAASAIAINEKVLSLNPRGESLARGQMGLGWSKYEGRDFDGAERAFAAAASVEGANADERARGEFLAGVAAERAGRADAALTHFAKVRSAFGQSEAALDAGLREARLLGERGKLDDAKRTWLALEPRLKDSPKLASLYLDRGWAALATGDKAAAEADFARVADGYPEGAGAAEALLKLAELAQERRDLARANERLAKLASRPITRELEPAVLYRKALIAFEEKKLDQAEVALRALVDRFPDDELGRAAIFWQAEVDGERQRPDAAIAKYQKVVAQSPPSRYAGTARVRIAQAHVTAKRWSEALAAADAAVASESDAALKAEADYVRGRALQQLARFDEAREAYGKAIGQARTETAAKAQFMIGETYFHQKKFADALKAYLKVEILYDYPAWQSLALLEAGKCHEQLDEMEPARTTYRRVQETFPATDAASKAKERLAALESGGKKGASAP